MEYIGRDELKLWNEACCIDICCGLLCGLDLVLFFFFGGRYCGFDVDLWRWFLDPWLDRGRSFGVGCGGVAGGVANQ